MTVRSKIRQPSRGAGSHPAIVAMVEQIRRVPSVERILLFGSRARGDHGERSDIDLAVACPGADDEDWAKIWLIVDDAPTLYLQRSDRAPGL
jgi:predicted nucleotidyltransferase